MYELFLAPQATVSWNDKGVVGVKRFLDRVWIWVNEIAEAPHQKNRPPAGGRESESEASYMNSDKVKSIT